MGAVNSCCLPQYEDVNSNKENQIKMKQNTRNLSATFNLNIDDQQPSHLLNINTATEDELMTLPGIGRATAHNIVEYRATIGGFKRVEDLALVSGVGAAKLNVIRIEICVGQKNSKNTSPTSSQTGLNVDHDKTSENCRLIDSSPRRSSANKQINVNTANVFQLMKINWLGQALAENIVAYRDKRGPFKNLDDLAKVRGIGPSLASSIRHLLTIETPPGDGFSTQIPDRGQNKSNRNTVLCRTKSEELIARNFINMVGDRSKFRRPKVQPFYFKRNNKSAVRIASWNLERLDDSKINNLGVLEVICMTVLENGISLIVIQEIASPKTLSRICDELNTPALPAVKQWSGHRGDWRFKCSDVTGRMFRSNEYNGFIYNASQAITLYSEALLEKKDNSSQTFSRLPYLAVFQIGKFDCVIVSVHLKAAGFNNEDLDRTKGEIIHIPHIAEAIRERFPGEKDIIILGDFNMDPDASDFQMFRDEGYSNIIRSDQYTNISHKNTGGSHTYDNIWLSKASTRVHTGHSGVVRQGLSHALIPAGDWTMGGVVSDHCPVWVEVYTNRDLDSSDLSQGVTGLTVH